MKRGEEDEEGRARRSRGWGGPVVTKKRKKERQKEREEEETEWMKLDSKHYKASRGTDALGFMERSPLLKKNKAPTASAGCTSLQLM